MAHVSTGLRPIARTVRLLGVSAASLLLTGCACGVLSPCVGPCEEEVVIPAPTPPPEPTPPPAPPPPPEPPAMRVVYFGFDDATISGQDMRLLQRHAAFLRENAEHSITVEGHCDERGSESYNSGLGMRRAEAVLEALSAQGVAATRMEAVTYGEKQPAEAGSDETAWAKNRRAVIIYYR